MTAKKVWTAAVLAAGVMMLGGCDQIDEVMEQFTQSDWEPQEACGISIAKDGTITEIIQEELDAAYYDAAELQNMINTEVQSYNKENKGKSNNTAEPITVGSYTVDGKKVRLEMHYATAEDYAQFNNVEFYYGSMIGAQLEGYLFDVSFQKVRDGVVKNTASTGTDVIHEMDQQVLIVRAPLEVHVPGSVSYTSTNAEILAADVICATGEKEEEQETVGLVLPSSAVYKPEEEEATFAEIEAANRVYIIFDME